MHDDQVKDILTGQIVFHTDIINLFYQIRLLFVYNLCIREIKWYTLYIKLRNIFLNFIF